MGAPPSLKKLSTPERAILKNKNSKIFSPEGPCENVSSGPTVALDRHVCFKFESKIHRLCQIILWYYYKSLFHVSINIRLHQADRHQFSSAGESLAYESFLVWSQQVREIQIKLNDEVTLPGRLIGMRHSLSRDHLPVTRAVSNSHNTCIVVSLLMFFLHFFSQKCNSTFFPTFVLIFSKQRTRKMTVFN